MFSSFISAARSSSVMDLARCTRKEGVRLEQTVLTKYNCYNKSNVSLI